MRRVELKIEKEIGISEAERYAKSIAEKFGENVLLSVCNLRTGYRAPEVYCCGERPWETYAASRGANLVIRINDFEFFFRVFGEDEK
ncbi:MAG: AF1514 family protein [Archaeoglobaceae archaeon]